MSLVQNAILLTFLLAATGLSGCEQAEMGLEVESIRPVKTIRLVPMVQAVEQRKFPGLVRAVSTSILSFEVPGKVLEIAVDTGDQVVAGQRLAVIDNEPFKLKVQSDEADLKKAQANYKNSASDYKRKSDLKKKGYVSASDLDQAQAQRDAALNQVTMVKSQLNISKRSMRNTELKAPFNGYISKRMVEPHQEIVSGQALFQLDGLEEMEVELLLPENIIGHLKHGDAGKASFPSLINTHVEGNISEIGIRAETANAFMVNLHLKQRPQGLYPGMTAEVELSIDLGRHAEGFLLPASAIVAGIGTGPGKHFVFVYNAKNSTVEKVPVFISGGQRQMARVSEGLQEGDIIVIAGTSFLSDGMIVKLLNEQD